MPSFALDATLGVTPAKHSGTLCGKVNEEQSENHEHFFFDRVIPKVQQKMLQREENYV